MNIEMKPVSPLEKVFPDAELTAPEYSSGTALHGDVFAFQLAVKAHPHQNVLPQRLFAVETDSILPVEVREVVNMPCEIPYVAEDDNLLRHTPGLYPDLLRPLSGGEFWRLPCGQWHALWITVRVPEDCEAGHYPVTLKLHRRELTRDPLAEPDISEITFDLEVLPAGLGETKLLRYEWLHADCLASYYGVKAWSEEHWRILENFVANGAAHDLNVLLTPLWTPPLDTVQGGERPTTQLLAIRKNGERYEFDFSRLERFIAMGLRHGVKRFAMSHAFTQWGAGATPKIVVEVDGRAEKLFGWHVPADAPGYAEFLRQLMPPLLAVFEKTGIRDKVFFSVSDEPSEEHLPSYEYASKLLKSVIDGLPTLDALSNIEFYRRGLVERPVVANNHIEPFAAEVREMWTYYCVGQGVKVPNRFFSMPSARNRIMGLMLYLYEAVGFLQWGFNFYNSQYSLEQVDPWRDTSAGRWVPSGDPFIVYPGRDGKALDSLRHEVFFAGLQDLRALQALEQKIGREAVIAIIQDGIPYRIRMDRYPRSAEWLLGLRERINRALAG